MQSYTSLSMYTCVHVYIRMCLSEMGTHLLVMSMYVSLLTPQYIVQMVAHCVHVYACCNDFSHTTCSLTVSVHCLLRSGMAVGSVSTSFWMTQLETATSRWVCSAATSDLSNTCTACASTPVAARGWSPTPPLHLTTPHHTSHATYSTCPLLHPPHHSPSASPSLSPPITQHSCGS